MPVGMIKPCLMAAAAQFIQWQASIPSKIADALDSPENPMSFAQEPDACRISLLLAGC
jgi:hypothetical protein